MILRIMENYTAEDFGRMTEMRHLLLFSIKRNNNYLPLLYRHECFTEKYTTCKIHTNYIRDPSGVFSLSSLMRILITSFPAFSRLLVPTVSENGER